MGSGRGVSLDMTGWDCLNIQYLIFNIIFITTGCAGRGLSYEAGERGGREQQARLQKSQSFGLNSSSGQSVSGRPVRSRSSSCETEREPVRQADSKMFHRSKHPDPLASLPSSQNRQYPAHSPSPSQSEYDTCDPWDDY